MKRQSKLEFVKAQLQNQRQWIKSCGGDLEGYIDKYGDPGVLTTEGKQMVGNGGTPIFEADMNALKRWYFELYSMEPNSEVLRAGLVPDLSSEEMVKDYAKS